MNSLPTPRSRRELMALLTDACELEHGIACSYLYAAFSLKKQSFDGGLTPEQLRLTRYWASQIFFVAAEEMLHMAQVWNLLVAIGGTPYCLRPNLPQSSRYYPIRARLTLEPFGERSLRRFITYETPARSATGWAVRAARLSKSELERGHVTIGTLYATVADGFRSIDDLFVGDRADQVGAATAMFSDLVEVHDTDSAIQAIAMITHQGEGVAADRLDCHFGVFREILQAYEKEVASSAPGPFEPARPVMDNPVSGSGNGYGAAAHPIKVETTRRAAELFDAVYSLMLQSLAFAFTPALHPVESSRAASVAIELMASVVRPLGEVLTTLPSGQDAATAGPAFGMTRFVSLPQEPALALRLIREQLMEYSREALALDERHPQHGEFENAAVRCREIAERMDLDASRPQSATTP